MYGGRRELHRCAGEEERVAFECVGEEENCISV